MSLSPNLLNNLIQLVIDARFLWAPIVLGVVFWKLWLHYIRTKYIQAIEWTLLEIKLPREITKSPRSIEVILNTFYQTFAGEWWQKYFTNGTVRGWFSLEIASIGGHVHFFIYTPTFFKNLVEAQVYGQFPDAEVVEVEDYTRILMGRDPEEGGWKYWGTEFKLGKEDSYPIKTYIDYDLHNLSTKEEQKTDPMTSFLEFAGSIGRNEHVWLQILIMATSKKPDEDSKELIDKLMGRDVKLKEGETNLGSLKLSPGERDTIESIERAVSKTSFDTGIRAMYFSPKDEYNPANQAALTAAMKQYNSSNLNELKPTNTTSTKYLFKDQRLSLMQKIMLDAYRRRSYFYMPYKRKSFIMNTEELATLYHFPGEVAETPTLGRIEAKKSEAPSNLPL